MHFLQALSGSLSSNINAGLSEEGIDYEEDDYEYEDDDEYDDEEEDEEVYDDIHELLRSLKDSESDGKTPTSTISPPGKKSEGQTRSGGGKKGENKAKDINLSTIYTPWTKWSKCHRRRCKKVRKRYCTVPYICGTNVLKEERPCWRGNRCKKHNFHIVKRRRLSQKTRGMLKFNKAFYTKWSKWSKCSQMCKTTRTR